MPSQRFSCAIGSALPEANPIEAKHATANTTDKNTHTEVAGNELTCVQLACWIYNAGLGMQPCDGAAWCENQRAIGHDYVATILLPEIIVNLNNPFIGSFENAF